MNDKKFWGISGAILVLFVIYWIAGYPLFKPERVVMFFAILLVSGTLILYIRKAERGEEIYLRTIPGLKAIEEAVGRSTEMGKPVLFVPGIMDMDQVETVAGVIVLGHVAKMTARYETTMNVPVSRAIVMKAAREVCRESYLVEGRPDLFHDDMVHYLTDDQFAYAAGVNGIMLREKPAACLYMGKFYAESLLLAETGNSIGAIQIAGTASPSQIPFFVTACDYTLIGEEFFAASAYLSRKPELVGAVKGQDMVKIMILGTIVLAVLLFNGNLLEYKYSDEWNILKHKNNEKAEIMNYNSWDNSDPYTRYLNSSNYAINDSNKIYNLYKNLEWNNLPKNKKYNYARSTNIALFWEQQPFEITSDSTDLLYATNNWSELQNDIWFLHKAGERIMEKVWEELSDTLKYEFALDLNDKSESKYSINNISGRKWSQLKDDWKVSVINNFEDSFYSQYTKGLRNIGDIYSIIYNMNIGSSNSDFQKIIKKTKIDLSRRKRYIPLIKQLLTVQ